MMVEAALIVIDLTCTVSFWLFLFHVRHFLIAQGHQLRVSERVLRRELASLDQAPLFIRELSRVPHEHAFRVATHPFQVLHGRRYACAHALPSSKTFVDHNPVLTIVERSMLASDARATRKKETLNDLGAQLLESLYRAWACSHVLFVLRVNFNPKGPHRCKRDPTLIDNDLISSPVEKKKRFESTLLLLTLIVVIAATQQLELALQGFRHHLIVIGSVVVVG